MKAMRAEYHNGLLMLCYLALLLSAGLPVVRLGLDALYPSGEETLEKASYRRIHRLRKL